MTTTNGNTSTRSAAETRAGLNARRSELSASIRDLIKAQERIALEAAEGDVAAPQRLASNYAGVNGATNELRAIEAALRALDQRDHNESMRASLDCIESDRAKAHACVQAVRPAFDRVATALETLGREWAALQQAQEAARRMERAHRGQTHNDLATAGAASVFNSAASIDATPLVQGRLWLAVGHLDPNHEMAKATPAALDAQIGKAVLTIDEGLRRREQYIRQQLADDPCQAA